MGLEGMRWMPAERGAGDDVEGEGDASSFFLSWPVEKHHGMARSHGWARGWPSLFALRGGAAPSVLAERDDNAPARLDAGGTGASKPNGDAPSTSGHAHRQQQQQDQQGQPEPHRAQYSKFDDAMEDWQLVRLEEAFQSSSRRNIAILALADETKLPRSEVLSWLKMRARMPPEQASTLQAACVAILEHEDNMQQSTEKKLSAKAYASMSIDERQSTRGGRMSPLALKTLAKFHARNRNPSWDHIQELAKATQLSPSIVQGWFKQNQKRKPRSPPRKP
eukprot:CAMPEP_0198236446 /NCGR_PEP_ID=MMETSP1446-20131203/2315_1 /TAXON_ID=1461542 ORGANISM="Unidentified sp, Strain CCMP2111" /NCGR_SAMPLE_ID=MMETSP1446 /ASSEMBLY_ACC=CAM_ASM_001112 /LENGTH=277 /DNA_ID=CAMNT_0043918165 /DNA_START=9 /DNA_END=843 /DNA_ORIENTATION=-